MKKIFTLILAGVIAFGMLMACEQKKASDGVEEKIVGYWETIHPLYGATWGYRFNEDGTLDSVADRQYERMGFYECRQDGVHYSSDGETWDDLVMVIVSLTDTEMTVDFAGEQTSFTKSDAELTEYMPEGWTYVEG